MSRPRKPIKSSVVNLDWDLTGGRDGKPVDLVKVLTREGGEQKYINKNANESTLGGLFQRGHIGMEEHEAGLRYFAASRAVMIGSNACKPMEYIPTSGNWEQISHYRSEAYGYLAAVCAELSDRDAHLLYRLIVSNLTLDALRRDLFIEFNERNGINSMPERCAAALLQLARAGENTRRFVNWQPTEA